MKSIIRQTVPPKILGLNLSAEKSDKLEKILSNYGIVFHVVDNMSGNEQIGYLCGFKGFVKSKDEPVFCDTECLIFSSVDRKTLNSLLKEFKKEELKINLKAIVTASNQSWTLKKLTEEIAKEHITMNGGDTNG